MRVYFNIIQVLFKYSKCAEIFISARFEDLKRTIKSLLDSRNSLIYYYTYSIAHASFGAPIFEKAKILIQMFLINNHL